MNRKRSIREHIQNALFYALYAVVFVAFFYLTVWGKDGLVELRELRKKKQAIVTDTYQLLKDNLLISEEIERFKNANYLEQRARSDLGMVRPNEVVYVIK